ncbi:fimbrial protein [Burkholderia stagnalis]|uniref:fimbrial protein n=1 Tax=Burkholderia stagnalis TaxID=1503054 RepID=UPI001E53078D|nr:fimbrial protein [Burkholderia stagnalis]
MMKGFSRVCLLAAFFLMPGSAWAYVDINGCSVDLPNGEGAWNPGFPGYKPIVYEAPALNISFNPNAPDGTVLFEEDINFTSTGGTLNCQHTSQKETRWFITVGPLTSNQFYYKTHQTSIPGVGMAIYAGARSLPISEWRNGPFQMGGGIATFRIYLVKTGKITAGGVITGEVAAMNLGYSPSIPPILSYRFGRGIVVQPQVPTCRVTTPAITVPLGSMPASTFAGVGSVSPSRPFNIVLQCSGGETGTVTNVYTTLTDHTDPGNVSDTLSLATDATATGLGIQVLNGSTVIKYGPDSSATGNTNQWKAGEAGNGTFTIPLTARYIQTAPKVTPGTADGLATFTMSYQ